MWLDVAIALSCCGGGLVCGWILHAICRYLGGEPGQRSDTDHRGEGREEPSRERISQVAARLRSYAASMAADVDAHQTRVQAVNHSLNQEISETPEAVLTAVHQLIEANEQMQSQLQDAQRRIHEQAEQIETAQRRAMTDALTRIPNRRAFDEYLARRHQQGPARAGCVALLDVDSFKQVNDRYGHQAGDEVLRVVAQVLHARLDRCGMVARFGGEEFAVVLDGYTVQQASLAVEAARIAIGQREISVQDQRLRVTASAGVAELGEGESIAQWLQRADDGLYHSKEVGRNCGHWMDDQQPVRIDVDCDDLWEHSRSHSAAHPGLPGGRPQAGGVGRPDGPAPASGLPDRRGLAARFSQLRNRSRGLPLFVMSVAMPGDPDRSAIGSLLQIVRATTRAVDQIGYENESTLLIGLPSIDRAMARELTARIVRAADAIGLGGRDMGGRSLEIGIARAAVGETFDQVVERALNSSCQSARRGTRHSGSAIVKPAFPTNLDSPANLP